MRQMKIGGRVNTGNMWRSSTNLPSKKQGINKDPLLANQRKGFRNTYKKQGDSGKVTEQGK